MDDRFRDDLIDVARTGIDAFLAQSKKSGEIDQQAFDEASQNVLPQLRNWLSDESIPTFSPTFREGLAAVISSGRWEDIVNAYRRNISFGTGGIRGMMAFDYESVQRLKEEGLGAPILKGPNTINDIVLLLTSAGVAKFGREQDPPFSRVVIGYDSRIRGQDFAQLVAQLFLSFGYTVFLFDEPCPYPEMTFAIPYEAIKGDIGILISASHNDYRYNGYKLSCGNGSQFDPKQRDEMYNEYIAHATPRDVSLMPFRDAPREQLVFLGGEEKVADFDYVGRSENVINLHKAHADHVKSFLLTPDLRERQAKSDDPLRIAYCAFHGAGRRAVPRLLSEVGFVDVRIIKHHRLNELDGMFPVFESAKGKEQQPDPGDERAARKAVDAYRADEREGSFGSFDEVDILIGTDPDADRCGIVAKVPKDQQSLYDGQEWTLLSADSMWTLLLWYRLSREAEASGGSLDAGKKFIVLSHTTSDSIVLLARKHGLGVIKTWVGFAALAAAVRDVWENEEIKPLVEGREHAEAPLCHPFVCEYMDIEQGQRSFNVAAMEQSNGFSILGGPPPDARSLGVGGHVRDKDGTMAALLVAEVAAWAKERGTTIFELVDKHVNLDPDIGLFVNHYEPDPMDGEYPGIQGDGKKKTILRRVLGFYQLALAGDLEIGGHPVKSAVIYRTGKYDAVYTPTYDYQFPDEGIRFYFDEERFDHLTVRPSGTGNSLRFHVQLRESNPADDLVGHKRRLMAEAKRITDDVRRMLKAPRD